jgi:glycosyltransferase involved in cell wall biosynthesis
MRVGMVVFANKWTGAGAVAELNCRALHSAGVDARLLFVGGRNLERRLKDSQRAEPSLVKERRLAHLRSNLRAVIALAEACDIVICHLPHDHLLCVAAGAHRRVPLVRAFRNPRHIRHDPFHRYLDRRLTAALCSHSALAIDLQRAAPSLQAAVLPVPLEDRFKPADGSAWRGRLGIPSGAPVIGAVGKLAEGRGFGLLLGAASRIEAPAHVVAVGDGESLPRLQKLAVDYQLHPRVHWTGYQDEGLPELYSAMDVAIFTAPGSDWGHRAISEAQGCGRPVVAVSCPGVDDLIEDGVTGRIVGRDPAVVALAVDSLITNPDVADRFGSAAATAAEDRRLVPIGRHLAQSLEEILSQTELH